MSRYTNEQDRINSESGRALAVAISKLCEQQDFRRFIRCFLRDHGALENGGLGQNVFTANALTTAHEQGKMAILQALVNYLCTSQPDIYSRILQEETAERIANAARLEPYAASQSVAGDE